MNRRGMLTPEAQKFARNFLGRDIDVLELRLYPFIDYCVKNEGCWKLNKVTTEEIKVLERLEKENHISFGETQILVTKQFYDYINEILAKTYVCLFKENEIEKENERL